MIFKTLYIGIYVCIMLQLIILGMVNLFQKRIQNQLLGLFCLLVVLSTIKIAFWTPIQGTLFFFLFGGPHESILAPLLYTYLLSIRQNGDRINRWHLIFPTLLYVLIHPVRILIFKYNPHHYDIVPFYLTITFLFIVIYFVMGLNLFKVELQNKLKAYPRRRFFIFYGVVHAYLLIKVFIFSPLAFNHVFQNPAISAFNHTITLPAYFFLVRGFFMILCIVLIYYAFTEIYWIKKYFVNLSIYRIKNQNAADTKKLEYLLSKKDMLINGSLNIADILKEHQLNKFVLKEFLRENDYANFSAFVNALRVQAFKEKINVAENQKYDLYSLARESGFKSKASFYRVFKELEGMTPSEYQKKQSFEKGLDQ